MLDKKKFHEIVKKHMQEKTAKASAKKKVEPKKVASKDVVAERKLIAKQTNVLATRLAKKLDDRMEKILFDAEETVKTYFPAKYVSASLTKLQKLLIAEGISCKFDKRVMNAMKLLRRLHRLLYLLQKRHLMLAILLLRSLLRNILLHIVFLQLMLCVSLLKRR